MEFYDDEEQEETISVEIPKSVVLSLIPEAWSSELEALKLEHIKQLEALEARCEETCDTIRQEYENTLLWRDKLIELKNKEIEWYRENAPVKYHLL